MRDESTSIANAIDFGEFPDEMMGVLGRLEWLPEWGMGDLLSRVQKLCLEAQDAELAAVEKRRRARQAAHDLMERVKLKWNKQEVLEATGYSP